MEKKVENKRVINKIDDKYKNCDFEFLFKINDDIICQRFFFINNFNDKSLNSEEIKYSIDDIIHLINEDLKSKTRIYLYQTCCSFEREEDLENQRMIANMHSDRPSVYKYEVFSKKDEDLNKPINVDNPENVFKFSFKYKNREVICRAWSADVYPSFIRNSVDITNKKKFENSDDSGLPFENQLLKKINAGRNDLIPQIINILCEACSN